MIIEYDVLLGTRESAPGSSVSIVSGTKLSGTNDNPTRGKRSGWEAGSQNVLDSTIFSP